MVDAKNNVGDYVFSRTKRDTYSNDDKNLYKSQMTDLLTKFQSNKNWTIKEDLDDYLLVPGTPVTDSGGTTTTPAPTAGEIKDNNNVFLNELTLDDNNSGLNINGDNNYINVNNTSETNIFNITLTDKSVRNNIDAHILKLENTIRDSSISEWNRISAKTLTVTKDNDQLGIEIKDNGSLNTIVYGSDDYFTVKLNAASMTFGTGTIDSNTATKGVLKGTGITGDITRDNRSMKMFIDKVENVETSSRGSISNFNPETNEKVHIFLKDHYTGSVAHTKDCIIETMHLVAGNEIHLRNVGQLQIDKIVVTDKVDATVNVYNAEDTTIKQFVAKDNAASDVSLVYLAGQGSASNYSYETYATGTGKKITFNFINSS